MRKLGAVRTAAAASSARPSMADASEGEERGKESKQWGCRASGSGSASTKCEEEVGALGSHGCHALATRRHFDEQVASAIQRVLEAVFGLVRLGI